MIILSDLGYLLRSELLLRFLGLFRLFEPVYIILSTLIRESMVDLCSGYVMSVCSLIFMLILHITLDSCLVRTRSAYSMIITLRSDANEWKTFAEPVRFGLFA